MKFVGDRPYLGRMQKVNGKTIVPVMRGGVRGHVMRSHPGVKLAAFYGEDSLQRDIDRALEYSDGTDLSMGEWYAPRRPEH